MSSEDLLTSFHEKEAFDALMTSVIIVDLTGHIQWVNAATQRLFERSRRTFEQLPFFLLFEDQQHTKKAFDSVVSQRALSANLIGVLTKPDEKITVSATFSLHQQWMMLELQTLQTETLSERSLKQLRESDLYRETFRNLAHEVNNPLGGIRGVAQLLEMELTGSAYQEYTRLIVDEVDRLQQLVNRLMHPRTTQLHKHFFNIHEVCEHVLLLLKAEYPKHLCVRRDYDASLPELYADKEKMIQVYLNLCRNAVQALFGEQEIKNPCLTLKTRITARQRIADKFYKHVLVLSIIDNGPGIAAHLKDKLFHPLVTGRAEGTGLGLSIAQELIQQHGGIITFETQVGQTEFRILLPLEKHE